MKLFKCHAVMPLVGHERTHVVKTYVVAADTWERARARIREEEPGALLVTMPAETPAVLLANVTSMSEREFADLRSACKWHEQHVLDAAAVPSMPAGQTPERPEKK